MGDRHSIRAGKFIALLCLAKITGKKMKNKQIQLDIPDDTFQSDYPRVLCEMRSRMSIERIDHGKMLHHISAGT